ncbi:MAG: AMP-binding protein [Burkholderiaceae bacterium]
MTDADTVPTVDALPQSRAHIAAIQSTRKRLAFERAKTAPWYQGKLDHIRADRLDDPQEWEKIPVLDKDTLRGFDHAGFMQQFCVAPRGRIAEYWRSGGTTGKPVFYPRTYEDVQYGLVSWGRSFPCIGLGREDLCHLAFPIGIHPAGQVWARSAQLYEVGMAWVGAGNSVPTAAQIDLIQALRPTAFLGMSSFALHMANTALARGIDLREYGVRTLVCTAESLSAAKREKLHRLWGAEVYDVFGMSEAGLMGAENAAHDGIHIWTDLFHVEVIDATTGRAVAPGEVGTFCVTPLWTNHATPLLRWNSGDLVSYFERSSGIGPFAELFPMIRHANRTTGFFKVRGINVNHSEFEDEMFRIESIADFQALLITEEATGREALHLRIEISPNASREQTVARVAEAVKGRFEITPGVEALPPGSLAQEFEKSIKAPRFVDKRL